MALVQLVSEFPRVGINKEESAQVIEPSLNFSIFSSGHLESELFAWQQDIFD